MALVVRIVDVEALGDEFGVRVVLGEDDGLAQAVAAGHLLAVGHQVREHLVGSVGIEQPFVEVGSVDGVGRGALVVSIRARPTAFLLVFGKVVVADPLAR